MTTMEEQEEKYSVNPYCEVCAGDMHIEVIDGVKWMVCNDEACQWMKKADQ